MTAPTLTDAERVDLLLAEIARLRQSRGLDRDDLQLERVERSRERQIEMDAYRALERQLAAARQDLAISEASNDALRVALRSAEAELASRNEQARVQKQALRTLADTRQDELADVRRSLAPLWPDNDLATTAELAAMTAVALSGHRAEADERHRTAERAEPERRPGWRRRLAEAVGLLALIAAGGLLGGAIVAAVPR